ncbi:MAG: flagellar FlbD family protein [Microthrixaceae bacterium]|nr:flagellar FlbD family protein [Microthrixaceae bacterium]
MILLRRLNGTELGVNADLIERVESTPDTILTLVDGTKYVVAEPAEEVVARIVDFRARILATAETFASDDRPGAQPVPLRLVQSDTDGEER